MTSTEGNGRTNFDNDALKTIVRCSEDAIDKQIAEPRNGSMMAEDKYIVKDIMSLFLSSSVDKDYHVNGVSEITMRNNISSPISLGYVINYGAADADIFTFIITGFKSLSMRQLMSLQQHGSVFDVIIESTKRKTPETSGNTESVLTVTIKIYKNHVNNKKMNVWKQGNLLTSDDNMTGLVMNNASKTFAKSVIALVNNMAMEDWEPVWSSSRIDKSKDYMLSAASIRRVTYSFYKYVLNSVDNEYLSNFVLVSDMIENVPTLTLMIFCKFKPDDVSNNDDDDYEDDEEEEEEHVRNHKDKKSLHGVKSSSASIKKTKTKKQPGLLASIYNSLFSK